MAGSIDRTDYKVTVDETTNTVTVATAIPSSGGPGTDTTAIHEDQANEIANAPDKAAPVGADILLIEDSEAAGVKKRVTITNLPGGADADAVHVNVAGEISPITEKVTPLGADLLIIEDSAAGNVKKRLQVGNLPTGIDGGPGTDTTAVHDDIAGEISAVTEKGTPIAADVLLIEDSAAGDVKKRVQIGNLPTGIDGGAGTDTTAIHDNVAGEIDGVAAKATPIAADVLLIEDSAAGDVKKKITVGSLPTGIDGGAGTDTTALHDNEASEISAIVVKGTPVGADFLLIEDSAAGNVKKHVLVSSLPGGSGTDDDAIHDNVAAEISAVTEKVSPVGADLILIEDSAAGNAKKRVQITNLPGGADADAIHDNVAAEISAITEKVTPVAADLLVIEDSAAANVKKRVQIGNLRSRVLLAEDTQINVAKLTVFFQEWDAVYDVIELELAVVGLSVAAMDIQPIDTGVATTTNLESNVTTHRGSRIAGDDNANWRTSATYPLGTGADDYLTGTVKFHVYNGGFLNGVGNWNYRSAAVHYSAVCAMARHTSVISRNDGFDVLMSTGNITGTARLYGLRND